MTARLVVLASGAGTNLQALLDAGAALDAAVVGVVSHDPGAGALARAAAAGVAAITLRPRRDRVGWERALAAAVMAWAPDLVVMAGWRRVLSPAFLARFPGRVINLHPALPGELPGLGAIARAHAEARAGRRDATGVMVHVATAAVDAGPVLVAERVPIAPDAPLAALEARVHAVEHRLLVAGVRRALADLL